MPELPEVEVTRLGLLTHVTACTIIETKWSGKQLRNPVPLDLLQKHISGQAIDTIERAGKYLLFQMANHSTLLIHLGMSGTLGLFPTETVTKKHDHLFLTLDSGFEIRLNDTRRFGMVAVWPSDMISKCQTQLQNTLGIEPFSKHFNAETLHSLARSRTVPIKNFLMNSRIIVGVGNIYANETLFAANIHPASPANSISKNQWKKLTSACRAILKNAIKAGGTTISDFLGSSGKPGYFQLQLKIYKRADQACMCCGEQIIKIRLGGRATYYCPKCQPPNHQEGRGK